VKSAILFPGQGIFFQQDLKRWMAESEIVRERITFALELLQMTEGDLYFRQGRLLEQTQYLQPILTAMLVGIHEELLSHGCTPDYVAGHSLGEVAAWFASGGISSCNSISLAACRSFEMAQCAARKPGSMVAVQLDKFSEEDILTAARVVGAVDLAARNSPTERVFSGEAGAMSLIATTFGGVMLDVAGPWHAQSMAPARAEFQAMATGLMTSNKPGGFVSNSTGQVVRENSEIPVLLGRQLTHPVQWEDVMATLQAQGVGRYIIPGPGKILRGLVRSCLNDSEDVVLVHDMAAMKRYIGSPPPVGGVSVHEE
jgi:[acyl-carrier-protein] S-malonyltransferase